MKKYVCLSLFVIIASAPLSADIKDFAALDLDTRDKYVDARHWLTAEQAKRYDELIYKKEKLTGDQDKELVVLRNAGLETKNRYEKLQFSMKDSDRTESLTLARLADSNFKEYKKLQNALIDGPRMDLALQLAKYEIDDYLSSSRSTETATSLLQKMIARLDVSDGKAESAAQTTQLTVQQTFSLSVFQAIQNARLTDQNKQIIEQNKQIIALLTAIKNKK